MLCGYIACTLDGYVADADGGVGFLSAYQDVDYGYDTFYQSVDAVVMGRRTYRDIINFGGPWPYAGKPGHVITSSALSDPPSDVARWNGGIEDYANEMASATAWVVGGPRLQATFIAAGLMSRLDVFVLPELLGDGIALFPPGTGAASLDLLDVTRFDRGLVKLQYRLGAS